MEKKRTRNKKMINENRKQKKPTPLGNKVLMYTLQIIKRKREERKVKKDKALRSQNSSTSLELTRGDKGRGGGGIRRILFFFFFFYMSRGLRRLSWILLSFERSIHGVPSMSFVWLVRRLSCGDNGLDRMSCSGVLSPPEPAAHGKARTISFLLLLLSRRSDGSA